MLEKLPKVNLDHLGVSTSVLCAVHCAAIPVLFSVGLVNTAHLAHNHIFDVVIVGVGLFIACLSLFKDYKKHKSIFPLLLALAGFVALGVAVTSHDVPVLVNVIGGLLVASAHLWNIRLYSACRIGA